MFRRIIVDHSFCFSIDSSISKLEMTWGLKVILKLSVVLLHYSLFLFCKSMRQRVTTGPFKESFTVGPIVDAEKKLMTFFSHQPTNFSSSLPFLQFSRYRRWATTANWGAGRQWVSLRGPCPLVCRPMLKKALTCNQLAFITIPNPITILENLWKVNTIHGKQTGQVQLKVKGSKMYMVPAQKSQQKPTEALTVFTNRYI